MLHIRPFWLPGDRLGPSKQCGTAQALSLLWWCCQEILASHPSMFDVCCDCHIVLTVRNTGTGAAFKGDIGYLGKLNWYISQMGGVGSDIAMKVLDMTLYM